MTLVAGLAVMNQPVQAILVSSIVDNGNAVTDQGSGAGILAFDIDWVNLQPVHLTLTLEAGDLDQGVLLSHVGIHPNNPGNTQGPPSGPAWSDYHLLINGDPIFLGLGDVFADTTLSTPSNIQQTDKEINVFFDQPESSGVVIFDQPLDFGQMSAGDTFTLTIVPTVADEPVVPEPATASLLGLAGLLIGRRRRTA
jgi:hypothetical protein